MKCFEIFLLLLKKKKKKKKITGKVCTYLNPSARRTFRTSPSILHPLFFNISVLFKILYPPTSSVRCHYMFLSIAICFLSAEPKLLDHIQDEVLQSGLWRYNKFSWLNQTITFSFLIFTKIFSSDFKSTSRITPRYFCAMACSNFWFWRISKGFFLFECQRYEKPIF